MAAGMAGGGCMPACIAPGCICGPLLPIAKCCGIPGTPPCPCTPCKPIIMACCCCCCCCCCIWPGIPVSTFSPSEVNKYKEDGLDKYKEDEYRRKYKEDKYRSKYK